MDVLLKEYWVVEFIEEENVEAGSTPTAVICSTWTFEQDDRLYCYWPTYVKSENKKVMMMKQNTTLDIDKCEICRINIKYKSRIYEKATSKLKYLEDHSTLSELSQEEHGRPIEKRIQKKKNRTYDDYISDASSDDFGNPAPVPKPPKIKAKILESTSENSGEKQEKSREKHKIIVIEDLMKQMIIDIRKLTEKVDYLITVNQNNINNNKEAILEDFSNIPTSIPGHLVKLNEDLADENTFNNMCTTLQVVGGKDVIDTTRRILSRLMTNHLATQYNWMGRNNKAAFVDFKHILKLILVAVRRNPFAQNATQMEVESVAKLWLRNSADRDGGRNRRKKEGDDG